MRLRRLGILRYGAFADRTFDFGDGSNDLHLIVGANEAGKSTSLAAIGDLLWGMGERPPFAFRYPYGELRLGGIIEHDGNTLEFIRRKARTASLLTPQEQPLPDATLAPFLGALDRDGFDRMFGLNHDRLRSGGQNMLSGKEDVARVLFEAGTGLSGVSEMLCSLDEEASAIFAGTARNKPLNMALKERETSLASMRTATMAPTKWKAIAGRLEKAIEDHELALQRTKHLEQQRSALERVQRVRPILTKIDVRTAEIERLGNVPALPVDAAALRGTAVTAIAAADFGIAERAKRVEAYDRELEGLDPRSVLLDHGDVIIRLTDGLALHRRYVAELPTAQAKVDDAASTRRRLLTDGGLSDVTSLPSAASRLQARNALDALDLAEQAVSDLEKNVLSARHKLTIAEQRTANTTESAGLAPLRAALGAVSRGAVATLAQHDGHIETAKKRSTRAFGQLAPWDGTVASLEMVSVPSADVLDLHRKKLADIAERRMKYEDEVTASQSALSVAQAELVRLDNLDREPPTPELLHEARASRDVSIVSLGNAEGNRLDILASVQLNVRSADELADRREAEAARVAEYAGVIAAIDRARSALADAPRQLAYLEQTRASIELEWAAVWRAAGFDAAVSPQQVSAWIETRTQVMDATDALIERERAATEFKNELERHHAALRRAMLVCNLPSDDDLTLDATIEIATFHLDLLERARDEAKLAQTRLDDAKQAHDEAVDGLTSARIERDHLLASLPTALATLNLGPLDAHTAELAITALDVLADRDDADRTTTLALADLERAIRGFDTELAALLKSTSHTVGHDAVGRLETLRVKLDDAKQTERDRTRLIGDRAVAISEITALKDSVLAERLRMDALMATAGVTDVDALDAVVERSGDRQRWTLEIAGLRDELADVSDGIPEVSLRVDVEDMPADDAGALLADVKRDQQEMIDVISTLSTELAVARAEEREAATGADAADAAQSSETARATVVDLSGRYIRAKSAATMLRWAINRHRETRQAPLLARAGTIFANITGGRFNRLLLDWSRGEEPVIVAERSAGERCGVDDMSEGTRDQLFLALRLAAMEEKSADHSMPLVCDDLFITADDARSARLFHQLKALSASNQVIIFTHHEHLVAVAENALGSQSLNVHHVQAT